MNEAVEAKDIILVQKIITDFLSSEHYKIQTLGGTIKRWINEIKNYFDSGLTNALTEGKHTQVKLFKRMAF
jgi:transposase